MLRRSRPRALYEVRDAQGFLADGAPNPDPDAEPGPMGTSPGGGPLRTAGRVAVAGALLLAVVAVVVVLHGGDDQGRPPAHRAERGAAGAHRALPRRGRPSGAHASSPRPRSERTGAAQRQRHLARQRSHVGRARRRPAAAAAPRARRRMAPTVVPTATPARATHQAPSVPSTGPSVAPRGIAPRAARPPVRGRPPGEPEFGFER